MYSIQTQIQKVFSKFILKHLVDWKNISTFVNEYKMKVYFLVIRQLIM